MAVEAALELKKCFNSTLNYVKMIDRTIDDMEKDDEYISANWYGGDDNRGAFEYNEHTKNKKILNDYTVPMLQQYAKPVEGEAVYPSETQEHSRSTRPKRNQRNNTANQSSVQSMIASPSARDIEQVQIWQQQLSSV